MEKLNEGDVLEIKGHSTRSSKLITILGLSRYGDEYVVEWDNGDRTSFKPSIIERHFRMHKPTSACEPNWAFMRYKRRNGK